MKTRQLPVLIIGAGIAGLSLARVLARRGIPVRIFERALRTQHQGYGITLRGWATLSFTTELGIGHDLFASTCATDAPIGGYGQIDPVVNDIYTGHRLIAPPPAPTGSSASFFFRANRNRLREFLMTGVDVSFNADLITMKDGDTSDCVKAVFSNGESAEGSLLVGQTVSSRQSGRSCCLD